MRRCALTRPPSVWCLQRYGQSGGFDYDTHYVWKALVAKGFTAQQAEVICDTLTEVIGHHNARLRTATVTKEEAQKLEEWVRQRVEAVKADMAGVRGSVESALQKQREEAKRIESSARLDLSLEKSRVGSELDRLQTMVQTFEVRCDLHTSKVAAELSAVKDKAETKLTNQRWVIGSVMIGGLSLTFAFIRFFVL